MHNFNVHTFYNKNNVLNYLVSSIAFCVQVLLWKKTLISRENNINLSTSIILLVIDKDRIADKKYVHLISYIISWYLNLSTMMLL